MPPDDSDNGSDSRLKPYIPSHVTPAIYERLNRLEQALSTLVTCVEDILTDTIASRESDGSITSLSIDSDILQDLLENVWLGQLLAAESLELHHEQCSYCVSYQPQPVLSLVERWTFMLLADTQSAFDEAIFAVEQALAGGLLDPHFPDKAYTIKLSRISARVSFWLNAICQETARAMQRLGRIILLTPYRSVEEVQSMSFGTLRFSSAPREALGGSLPNLLFDFRSKKEEFHRALLRSIAHAKMVDNEDFLNGGDRRGRLTAQRSSTFECVVSELDAVETETTYSQDVLSAGRITSTLCRELLSQALAWSKALGYWDEWLWHDEEAKREAIQEIVERRLRSGSDYQSEVNSIQTPATEGFFESEDRVYELDAVDTERFAINWFDFQKFIWDREELSDSEMVSETGDEV